MLIAAFLGTLAIFTAAILLVARSSSSEEEKLAERFAGLRAKNAAGQLVYGELLKKAAPEANGLEKFLSRFAIAEKIQVLISQADSSTTVRKLVLTCLLAGLGTGIVVLAVVPARLVGGVAALGASYLPLLLLQMKRGRRVAAFNKAMPDAIEMMARSLRAGYSPIMAIGIIAENSSEPVRAEFAEVFRKQNFGLPLREALMQMLERVPSADLRVFVTGVLVQKDTGGNLAEILDRIGAVIRERLKIQGEIRTHTAQGRMTGWILCLMPVGMLIAINTINPGYSKALTDDPLGRKLLYLGVGLLCTGAFMIRRIVNSVEV